MLKTFTLDNKEEEQVTMTQGVMVFHITDENGDSRTVSGSTFLNADRVAQGISSENKRELPLIEGLFRLELGESIEIEFEYYNEDYDRETNKTINQVALDTVMEMEKEKKVFYRITNFFKGYFSNSVKNA